MVTLYGGALIGIILIFVSSNEHGLFLSHLIIILECGTVSASDHVSVTLFGVVDSTETSTTKTELLCVSLDTVCYVTYMAMLM